MKILVTIFALFCALVASPMDFSFIKKGDGSGPTVLVIGGIQGDEPGGFTAATLLATHYNIKNGNLWIVPNLNFESIIKRSRGVYGDMNRKFKNLSERDPEFEIVEKVKKVILDEDVDLIVNLHDGSGFYREKWESRHKNPHRWGQCSIIDQERIEGVKYGNLQEISEFVVKRVNERSIDEEFNYRVNNTRTPEGNVEMAKSLTWFAVKNGKPAFGNEASKAFLTHTRAFYHLLAVEGFMEYAGIEFERDFELTPENVKLAVNEDVKININDKVVLDVTSTKNWLNYFPLRKGSEQKIVSNNPLATVVNNGNHYRIHYGNRRMTILMPEYFEFDDSISEYDFSVDGEPKKVKFGSTLEVGREFIAEPKDGYRVNVIGFAKKNVKNESGISVGKRDIIEKYSIDKYGKIYRVEVYNEKENKFAGMILVKFKDSPSTERVSSLK